ncbi:MAG: succinate dehydrogenase cytochrome b subunit [Planctomycetaceae bacterium]
MSRIISLPAVWLSRVPACAPFVRACSTSVGQKVLMAMTGLLLCGFLVVHLAGNFLLFAGETAYNDYAHALHSKEGLLKIAEIGLFTLFVLHIGLAFSTAAMNRQARRVTYSMKESKQGVFALPGGGASTWMMVTGLVVLGFLLVHLSDLTWHTSPDLDYDSVTHDGHTDPFGVARLVLQNPLHAAVYSLGCLFLGIHLFHAVASAFQTLGLSHPKWNPIIRCAGRIFAWVIALGFLSCVAWGLFLK